jgi:hypothetical protein
MSWTRTAIAVLLVGTLSVGCGGGADGAPGEPATAGLGETAVAGPVQVPLPTEGGAAATPPELQAIVDAARADAAARTGVPLSALVVTSAEAVIWPDGSLGCPMPGMAYTMALVSGHRVVIRAGEVVLDYHAGGRQLILCPAERAIDPLPQQRS